MVQVQKHPLKKTIQCDYTKRFTIIWFYLIMQYLMKGDGMRSKHYLVSCIMNLFINNCFENCIGRWMEGISMK